MRRLIDLMERSTSTGEEGRWITTKHGPVFISDNFASRSLGELNPNNFIPKDQRKELDIDDEGKQRMLKGKPKMRYTKAWRLAAAKYKYARAAALEEMRGKIHEDLEVDAMSDTLTNDKAAATAMLLMSKTGIRAQGGGLVVKKEGKKPLIKDGKKVMERHYAVATLLKSHVNLDGDNVTLKFVGKSGVNRTVEVKDKVIAKSIRDFMGGDDSSDSDEPLFTAPNGGKNGKPVVLKSSQMNRRLKRYNKNFKSKDFRTSVAMRVASKSVMLIMDRDITVSSVPKKAAKQAMTLINDLGAEVSKKLGNKPGVAIQNYTSPELVEHMLESLGFSADTIDGQRGKFEESEGFSRMIGRKTPILLKLLGKDALNDWADTFARDDEDASYQPVDFLQEGVGSHAYDMFFLIEDALVLAGLA